MFSEYLNQAVFLTIVFSVVPLAAASAAGLAVSLVQAATQIQEQSVQFLVRLAVICAVVSLFREFILQEFVELLQQSFETLLELGRLK